MNLDQLMTFIDKLTPQQAGGYLSGQTPFPYQGVPNELWAPRMMAAAHRKMAAGGAVKPAGRKLSKSMQDVLLKRFAKGGDVYISPAEQYLMSQGYTREEAQAIIAAHPEKGIAESTAATPMGRKYDNYMAQLKQDRDMKALQQQVMRKYQPAAGLSGMFKAQSDAERANAQTILDRVEGYRPVDLRALLSGNMMVSTAPDMAGLNAAIESGKGITPMPEENKQNAKQPPVVTPAAPAQGVASVQAAQKPVNTILDTADFETAAKRLAPKTPEENMKGLQAVMAKSREKERLEELQKQQAVLEGDRKRDMWLGLLQAAGQSMAEGNRSFLGALGSTAAGGAKNVSAAEKEYRGRKGELAKQKMGIEDTADAYLNQIALKGFDLSNEQNKTAVELELKRLGLSEKQIELAFKRADAARDDRRLAMQEKYYDALGKAATTNAAAKGNVMRGPMGLTPKEAFDMAVKESKIPGASDPLVLGKNPKLQQELMAAAARFYGGPLPAGSMIEGADEMSGWSQPKVTGQ